ncbi:MAG: hypothetical protein AAFY65_01370 [Pseudomonadota bacterium]
MTGRIFDNLPLSTGAVVAERELPDFGERAAAARTIEQIETDSNRRREKLQAEIIDEVWTGLPEDMRQIDPNSDLARSMNVPQIDPFAPDKNALARGRIAFDAIQAERQTHPDAFRDVPSTPEELAAEVDRRQQAELDEARAVLDLGPEGFDTASLFGSTSVAFTDQTQMALMLAGAPPGAGVARTIAVEAGIGAASEAAEIPDRLDAVNRLDGASPVDPVTNIAAGAVLGGVFGGLIKGVEKVLTRRASPDRPENVDALTHEQRMAEAETNLDRPASEQETENTEPAPEPVASPDQAADAPPVDVEAAEDTAPAQASTPDSTAPDAVAGADAPAVASPAPRTPLEDTVNRIISIESSGNPNAKNPESSATGLGQFIASTWMGVVKKHRPDLLQGRSRAQVLALRRDPALSRELLTKFTEDNQAVLRANGIDPGPGETYLAHFLGVGGAVRVLRMNGSTPLTQVLSPGVIKANAGIRYRGTSFRNMSVDQLRAWARSKMGKANNNPVIAARGGGGGAVGGPTSRGYMTAGQVTAGDQLVDVRYEVVDASTLRQASGDLQPRDRSRASSDEQIAEIAARLDPARLLPAPEADRGAPVVGPDNVIESGNGRVAALGRAQEVAPDRVEAYRDAVEAAGFEIPQDVRQPVLIARRTSNLSPDARRRFVRAANTSTIARMSPAEQVGMDAAAITPQAAARLDPDQPLTSAENAPFVRDVLDNMPQTERSALVTADGALNPEGVRRIEAALFGRAFDAADLRMVAMETGDKNIASLVEGLERAAPDWAKMRVAIEAGDLQPEFDISGHVHEAMRLLALARQTARAEGGRVASIIDELIREPDLIDGALAPLSAALMRNMAPKGRILPADKVGPFLARYAREAAKVGQSTDALFAGPTPLDVLARLDKKRFGKLSEMGTPRGIVTGGLGDVNPTADAPDFAEGPAAPEAEAVAEQMRQELDPRVVPETPSTPDVDLNERADIEDALRARQGADDVAIRLDEGREVTASQLLDEMEQEDVLQAVADTCPTARAL